MLIRKRGVWKTVRRRTRICMYCYSRCSITHTHLCFHLLAVDDSFRWYADVRALSFIGVKRSLFFKIGQSQLAEKGHAVSNLFDNVINHQLTLFNACRRARLVGKIFLWICNLLGIRSISLFPSRNWNMVTSKRQQEKKRKNACIERRRREKRDVVPI